MLAKVIEELKKIHGEDLELNDGAVHYLFFKDGLFSVYLDEETSTLKVDVEFLPEDKTFIYHSEESLSVLMKQ